MIRNEAMRFIKTPIKLDASRPELYSRPIEPSLEERSVGQECPALRLRSGQAAHCSVDCARYDACMDALVIREASEDDVAAILELYRDAELEGEPAFTIEEAQAHLAVFSRYPSYRIFVAVLDEEIVGTYELLIMDNLAKGGRKSAVVEDVAVSPKFRGQGIGRAMMMHAREQCKRARCYKFVLSSNLKRADAHAFYESLGFEKHGSSFRVELE
jgi:GNAT superfamily N-acetyltransferase